ncbi:hypothetical protein EAH86_13640 [Pedococcus bigeumensis]|uniref:Uncharacterized protein n=1 Tax=Pedococcus bigeumensis TaxID=433644 RepID=A0A502CTS8_9MICO|nr:hypothetical protein EAH86_13640 [Pedococcus bigeumensis]
MLIGALPAFAASTATAVTPGLSTPTTTSLVPTPAPRFGFQPLTPARLVDTRSTSPVGPGGVLAVPVLGHGGVPASGVGSVALNITAVTPTSSGFLTAWPTGSARPATSTVNFTAGQVVPNNTVLGVGTGGTISVYNLRGSTHVIVDVTGWFPTGSGVTAVPPARVLDTRSGSPLGPGGTRTLKVAGTSSPSVPADAVAVTLNITATGPTATSYLTVYPAGASRPTSSTLNMVRGSTVANATIATVGAAGSVTIANASGSVHVIADLTGYLLPGMGYVPLVPVRVADTRSGDYFQGGFGFDAPYPVGTVNPASMFDITVPRRGSAPKVPFGAGSVVLNVTAIAPDRAGYLKVVPGDGFGPLPSVSTLNFTAGQVVANGAIVGSPLDEVSLKSSGAVVDAVVDVLGYFPADGVGLMRLGPNYRTYSLGTDRIGVIACNPTGYTVPRAQAVANLTAQVTPFFTWLSGGRYVTTFVDAGAVSVADADSCLNRIGAVSTAGKNLTMALGVDGRGRSELSASGLAGPGSWTGPATYPQNGRDGQVTASSVLAYDPNGTITPFYNVTAHELGHTLDFPHSYVISGSGEYTNVMDLMSSTSALAPWGDNQPQATIAANRLRAGWIDPDQVARHQTSGSSYVLNPIGVAGTQMVAIPGGRDGKFVFLDARTRSGYDLYAQKEGVEVYLAEDQPGGSGIQGRLAPAVGAPDSTDHVLGAGEALTLGGGALTVSVGARNAQGGYTVTVTGTSWNFPTLFGAGLVRATSDVVVPEIRQGPPRTVVPR